MSDVERREVPRLTGTSHASFVPADGHVGGKPRASLRFWTVTGELPACGHGTVAALAFLAENSHRRVYDGTPVVAGRSFAGRATPEREHVRVAFDPGDVEVREATASERDLALDALGHDPGVLGSEACVASIGRPRLLAPISTHPCWPG